MIITVWNIKGGVGKGTLSMNLVAAGYPKSCLIDLEGEECIDWMRRGERLPSSRFGGRVAKAESEDKLYRLLDQAKRNRWSVIINAPGTNVTPLIRAAVEASTLVLIPLRGDQVEVPDTVKTIKEVRKSMVDYLLVLNKAMPRVLGRDARHTAAVREMLLPYKEHLWTGQITHATVFDKAAIDGTSVFDVTSKGVALEVSRLWQDLLQRASSTQT